MGHLTVPFSLTRAIETVSRTEHLTVSSETSTHHSDNSDDYANGNILPYISFLGVLFVVVTIFFIIWLKYNKSCRKLICCKSNSTRSLPVISHPIHTSSPSRSNDENIEMVDFSPYYLEPVYRLTVETTSDSDYEDVQ